LYKKKKGYGMHQSAIMAKILASVKNILENVCVSFVLEGKDHLEESVKIKTFINMR
jgi:hypothetical protein